MGPGSACRARPDHQHKNDYLMSNKISLPDFFKYYKGTVEQKEAIVLLESQMPHSLLQSDSSWVIKYREKPEAPPSVVPPQCLDIIAEFEGFRPTPYLCPAGYRPSDTARRITKTTKGHHV